MSASPSSRAGSVQAIDKDAVHRICSGQVVVDLATAVKELVENSLDAGSTTVDVRLRDYGASLIEVTDNGKGIAAEDYAGITRKHCTSKLRDFSDLAQVETFGFRGEALSSLCAVSEVSIATRRACDAVGTRLVYDHRGEITSQAPCAREPGTTVTVQKLFSTLPVRHKQLQKNVKREYARLLHVLQAYCLICHQARIHCSNQSGEKGQRHIVVASANKPTSQKSTSGPSTNAGYQNSEVGDTKPATCPGTMQPNAGSDASVTIPEIPSNSPPSCVSQTAAVPSHSGSIDDLSQETCSASLDSSLADVAVADSSSPSVPEHCLRQNVISVFGAKQLSSLLVFQQCSTDDVLDQLRDDGMAESSLPASFVVEQFSVAGLLSDCQHGQGRSTTDRQFFYVNDRPWDATRAAKVVNEVYRSYNRHQSPFVLLLVSISERSSVDVNLTPDKRSMLLEHEKVFLALLKRSLQKLFAARDGCYGVDSQFQAAVNKNAVESPSTTGPVKARWSVESLKRRMAEAQSAAEEDQHSSRPAKQPRLSAFGFSMARPAATADMPSPRLSETETLMNVTVEAAASAEWERKDDSPPHPSLHDCGTGENQEESGRLVDFTIQSDADDHSQPHTVGSTAAAPFHVASLLDSSPTATGVLSTSSESIDDCAGAAASQTASVTGAPRSEWVADEEAHSVARGGLHHHQTPRSLNSPSHESAQQSEETGYASDSSSPSVADSNTQFSGHIGSGSAKSPVIVSNLVASSDEVIASPSALRGPAEYSQGGDDALVIADDRDCSLTDRFCLPDTPLICSTSSLAARLASAPKQAEVDKESRNTGFMVRIGPDTNEAAEKELERYVSKASFARMNPVGQFNLGFIIGQCDSDLFLVDQHASDEKYNFERLQRTAQPKQQPLVLPQQLSLPAGSEQIVMDNIGVFEQSGFKLDINMDAEPTQRIHLLAAPASKSWNFGVSDIEEMVYMLTEASPGQVVRPTRLRAMFASRACRSSIMIGRALNRQEMCRLLTHMSEMDQPWNCPHGRPTMRHLFDLTRTHDDFSKT